MIKECKYQSNKICIQILCLFTMLLTMLYMTRDINIAKTMPCNTTGMLFTTTEVNQYIDNIVKLKNAEIVIEENKQDIVSSSYHSIDDLTTNNTIITGATYNELEAQPEKIVQELEVSLYTEEELEELAHLIFAEAGSNSMPDEALYYTGSVVLNRVNSKKYPNTIHKVINQKHQYGVSSYYMKKKPTKRCYKIAKDLLENGSILPKDCLGQAGRGTYKKYGKKLYAKVKDMYFFSIK